MTQKMMFNSAAALFAKRPCAYDTNAGSRLHRVEDAADIFGKHLSTLRTELIISLNFCLAIRTEKRIVL